MTYTPGGQYVAFAKSDTRYSRRLKSLSAKATYGSGRSHGGDTAITARPGLRVLFSSGYSMNAIHTNFILDEGLALIQKPCQRDDLLRKVRDVLGALF